MTLVNDENNLLVLHGELLVVVHVALGDLQATLQLAGKLVHDGRERTARAAPRGPEVDEDGKVLAQELVEVGGGDLGDVRHGSSYGTARGAGGVSAAPVIPRRAQSLHAALEWSLTTKGAQHVHNHGRARRRARGPGAPGDGRAPGARRAHDGQRLRADPAGERAPERRGGRGRRAHGRRGRPRAQGRALGDRLGPGGFLRLGRRVGGGERRRAARPSRSRAGRPRDRRPPRRHRAFAPGALPRGGGGARSRGRGPAGRRCRRRHARGLRRRPRHHRGLRLRHAQAGPGGERAGPPRPHDRRLRGEPFRPAQKAGRVGLSQAACPARRAVLAVALFRK